MNTHFLRFGTLFLFGLLLSGCDSGQYGESTTTEPQAESALSLTTESPNTDEPLAEPLTVEGAILAAQEAAGAGDNAEGVNHFQQGHWDVAQEHFNKALAINADLPEAHYNLALALDKLGNYGDATNHFSMSLKLAPNDPRIADSEILKTHVGG